MRTYATILLSTLLLCCTSKGRLDKDIPLSKDALPDSSSSENETVQASDGAPLTTSLPLMAHFKEDRMSEMVKNAPVAYKLPTLEKINYIITDSSYSSVCENGSSPQSVFNFKRYRYKLPAVAKYQVYIVCDTTFDDYRRSAVIDQSCLLHVFKIHAYLILFDSTDRHANVINIQNKRLGAHGARRTFDIDKQYIIHIQDYELSSETEDAEEIPTLKQAIILDSNGDIRIETPSSIITDEGTGKIISQKPATRTIISADGTLKSSSALKN